MKNLFDIASGFKRRVTGRPVLYGGEVEWEHLRFYFQAEGPIFRKAKERGIENGLCRLIMSECRPGSIAVDVGVNYGFVTTVMAHAVGPTGRVHSFEPVPSFCDSVEQTLGINGIHHVTLHRKAAGGGAASYRINSNIATSRLTFLSWR